MLVSAVCTVPLCSRTVALLYCAMLVCMCVACRVPLLVCVRVCCVAVSALYARLRVCVRVACAICFAKFVDKSKSSLRAAFVLARVRAININ